MDTFTLKNTDGNDVNFHIENNDDIWYLIINNTERVAIPLDDHALDLLTFDLCDKKDILPVVESGKQLAEFVTTWLLSN